MPEPCTLEPKSIRPGRDLSFAVGSVVSRQAFEGPLWSGVLAPPVGQRLLVLGYVSRAILDSILGIEEGSPSDPAELAGELSMGPYDLLLEEVRTRGRRKRPGIRRSQLVAPGGRWIAILQGNPAVGFHGRALLRQARREGFQRVETYYAHPSLAAPKILVSLDRIEPIRYFLDFALGGGAFRRHCLGLGLSALAKLGVHREILPNMILTATKGR